MKKLAITLTSVLFAVCTHAATVNWVMAGITQPETTTAASGYAAYLFASSVSESLASTYSAVSQSTLIAAIEAGNFGDYVGNAISSATTGTSGNVGKTGIAPTAGFGAGDSLTLYAVVFDAASYGDAAHYAATASSKTASFTSATGAKTINWASFSSTAGQGWTAVPEPTSGLLMLLGMAGLALRRRRA